MKTNTVTLAKVAFARRKLLLLLLLSVLGQLALRAADLLVSNLNDSGPGSLREAILDNGVLGGGKNIVFTNGLSGTITLTSGELAITNNVTIAGPGAKVLGLNGNNAYSIFDIFAAANATISGLSLSGTSNSTGCVKIASGSVVTMSYCSVVTNAAIGINSAGALTLLNSTVAYNVRNTGGGGGIASGGDTTLINCTVAFNRAKSFGGINFYGNTLNVSNSTIVGNAAIFLSNLVPNCGGINAANSTGLPIVRSSIIAGNSAAVSTAGNSPDVISVFTSGGYNLIGANDGSTGFANGVNHDLVGVVGSNYDPLVGPLQDNGGPTFTMALLPGSPAIDQGISDGFTVDQRGQLRTFDFLAIPNAADGTDIGAFEASTNYSITLNSEVLTRGWAISNSPGQSGFQVSAAATVEAVTNTAVLFNFQLVDSASGITVPLQSTQAVVNVGAGGTLIATNLSLVPATQLDSVDRTFNIVLTLAHTQGGTTTNDLTNTIGPLQLLHFNGRLLFGPLVTYFTNIETAATNGVAGNPLDCTMVVSTDAGYLPLVPGRTYGDGATPIPVSLLVNGDAVLKNGATVALHGPVPDKECIQNICFQRTNAVLTTTGMVTDVWLSFPTGFSIGLSTTNRITGGQGLFPGVSLDASLHPAGGSLSVTGAFYAVQETLPYWFSVSSLTWLVNTGQLQLYVTGGSFVRQLEDDRLRSWQAALVETNTANRISNDGYFRNATAPFGLMSVIADAQGTALLNASILLFPTELRPHFPYTANTPGSQIPTGLGLLTISNNLPATNSYLALNGAIPVSYSRDCAAPGCTAAQAGPGLLNFTATGGRLAFTPDGGLLAYGSVPAGNVQWGYATGTSFAQTALNVSAGAYCMAGTFLRADQTAQSDSQRAAVILSSGFGDASNLSYLERPGGPGYIDGFANYPGLNFRSPVQGFSHIGQADLGPYLLHPASKYYVRFGGVNGIHQAAGPPGPVPMYGYNFTFSSFAFSYLDGQNQESRTDGAIQFPAQPAGFLQPFDRMKVTCRGDLQSAQIPANSTKQHLAYWNVDFTPQSLDFHPTNDEVCGTSPRFLVLGVETRLPLIPQALHAALGFKPNGNLVTPADNVTNVDSRFEVPGQLSVQGPGTTMFTLATATEGYFNNWETPGAASLASGFYNLAGKLRVPFFTDIKVHLQVTPLGATDSHIDIMGGWPAADSADRDLGWSVNTSNYFNTVKFDPTSDGWPAAQNVALKDYTQAATPDGQYHPRAQRDWIEVAKFDYPLSWNSTLHRFAGFAEAPVSLPVIDVNSKLKELAPGKVDFDFAQDVSLQLPRIKVLDVVNDALNGNIGPLVTISNAIRSVLGRGFDATGLNELSRLLREDAQSFINPILNDTLDPLVNAVILPQLTSLPQTNPAVFLQLVYSNLTAVSGGLQSAISGINSSTSQVSTVASTIDKTLTDVEDTAGLFYRMLEKTNGQRQVIKIIVQKLLDDQGPALGLAVSLGDAQINPLLDEIDPTLAEIQAEILDVSNQIAQVHGALSAANGDFSQALGAVLQDSTGMLNFMQSAATDVTNYLASVLTPAGDLFSNNQAAVAQALRQQISMAFLSSAFPANYQKTFRQFLFDKDFLLNQLMDVLFDQINSTIRNGIADSIQSAQDGILKNMKGAGFLSQSLLAAKIRGSPTFNGDSLRKIHLDAAVKMNLPDEMNFNAYMDIKELDSQSAPFGCIPPGAPAAEVTLGARDVKLDWPGVSSGGGPPLLLTAEARWTLQSGAVRGIGGLIEIKGEAGFEGCTLKDIAASLAIGQIENYFSAKAAGSIAIEGIPVDLQAGIFVGHACSLDPLRAIDAEVDQVLGRAVGDPGGFSGLYVQIGGGVSLSEILFHTSSCLLDLNASVTLADYYEGGPRGRFGGREKLALDASVLCLVSAHADLSEFMSVTAQIPPVVTVGGSADICGKIGYCPFCIGKCVGVSITGVLSTGGINYDIHY